MALYRIHFVDHGHNMYSTRYFESDRYDAASEARSINYGSASNPS